VSPGPAPLAGKQKALDGYFAHDTVEEIVAALKAGSSWAQEQAAVLATKAPLSMKVSLRELRQARGLASFADEMAVAYRLACRVISTPDFQAGVRAVVVDTDNAPRWDPARLEDVSDDMLDGLFAPLEGRAEWTPLP